MIALVRAELLKMRSTRTALGLSITVLVLAVVPLTIALVAVPKDFLGGDEAAGVLTAIAGSLVPMVLLVFGILGMTSEYRHGTITYSYLVTPKRWQVMVIKLAVYGAVGIVTMLVTVVLVYLVIRAGGAIRGVEIDATGGNTLADYARQIIVAGLITTFGVGLGALIRLQVVTVAGTLMWALFAEGIIQVLKPSVGAWLPFVVFNRVSAAEITQSPDVTAMLGEQLSRSEAFFVSLAYIAIVSVAAVFISLRRDVT